MYPDNLIISLKYLYLESFGQFDKKIFYHLNNMEQIGNQTKGMAISI